MMLSGPAALLIFTLSRIPLTSAVEEIRIQCFMIIRQYGLINGWGTLAFVGWDVIDHLTHIICFLSVVFSPVSAGVSILPPWSQFSVLVWWRMLLFHLTRKQLSWHCLEPSTLHSCRLSDWGTIFLFWSPNHQHICWCMIYLIMFTPQDWCSHVAASLNLCQFVHSNQSYQECSNKYCPRYLSLIQLL